ncbi:MAG: DUF354 domain-containing protein [Candidatus Thiodiazotropha sp.]
MKIWIDITNAPHVNFFKQFIDEWHASQYEVIVTTRPLSNTIELLEENNISYHCIGSHYGKNKLSKVYGFFKRSKELFSFLKNMQISVAISQSSFYSPYVARRLKIPCIYTNDNEFAKGNYIAFVFTKYILLPEALEKWARNRFFSSKVTFYPGVKEGIYINPTQKEIDYGTKAIYFRPEPWHAQYHNFQADLFDNMLINLTDEYQIVLLPRDQEQKTHFSKLSNYLKNLTIADGVETVETISHKCSVFLGAGGSMTREFALMGIPTVSMYQGILLEVDKYLIQNQLLISQTNPQKITKDFISNLFSAKKKLPEAHKTVYNKGKQARELIHQFIEKEINKGVQS